MSPWDKARVLEQAQAWCQAGQVVWLFHVIRTWGSSPRPPGSLMAMNAEGLQYGSVSGGCVEADLAQHCTRLSREQPQVIDYDDTSPGVNLPCGGGLRLVAEPVSEQTLHPLLQAYQSQQAICRSLHLESGTTHIESTPSCDDIKISDGCLLESYGPRWRLLIIGAEHLATLVSRMAQSLEYQVIVCEPREEKRTAWQEEGTTLSSLMPDEAVAKYVDPHCALLALAHDPRLDDLALLPALAGPAFYVGALGSRASARRRRQRLQSLGLSEFQLTRLEAPIGLDIGSRSAAEIAISIVARLVQVRSQMRSAI